MNCNRIIYDKDCNTIILDEYDDLYAYIYVLQLNQTTGLVSNIYIRTEEEDIPTFNLGMDGFYTLVTLKIPKEEGLEYYYKDDKFYHYYNEVDLETLLELNPEVSHLDITYYYYFQTCRLRKCYINICYLIFDQVANINCNKSSLNKELVYKRDLIWSTLNVISYMTEMDLFEEAERLLERVMGCNGLCNNNLNDCYKGQRSSGCGCK